MGRPEPCVLFAQTILHSQLDEYVDEVTFSEPVVITACEFLEQGASPSTPNLSLLGATSPPSFALEVFVHSEGESRFRRLSHPFLYSHSSSNVLEVEAIVTSHLVLRGTYRSLTLVIYGNTAEDLGQFNIEFDLDNSLANVVYSPSEGKLEDLPPALHTSTKFTFNEPLPRLKSLTLQFPDSDISPQVKKFLSHALRASQDSNGLNFDFSMLSSVISSISSLAMVNIDILQQTLSLTSQKSAHSLDEARDQLLQIWKEFRLVNSDSENDLSTTELMAMFSRCFPFFRSDFLANHPLLSEDKSLALCLGLVLLLCSSREGCFHFVSIGGMDKIIQLLSAEIQDSTFFSLLLVSIIECATRHGIGCEAFLGWYSHGDETVPICASIGYTLLLRLLLEKQRHDIASMATYVLHRLRFFETLSRYESAVVSVLDNDWSSINAGEADLLVTISSELSQLSKLLNMCEPIEDPSPVGVAKKMLNSGSSDILLSSKATINCIANSKYSFTRFDVDKILLSLLKERGFFPLSAALLSSPMLRSANASRAAADILVESAISIESILLSLLLSRSGLTFLLDQAEATELLVLSLKDVEDSNKAECTTLRQAYVLLSTGFFCHPQDVATITEIHIRVASLFDRLLVVSPNSDELLWLLWELCAISRSDTGRQALLAIIHFPEAVSVLLDALCSYKDQDQASPANGSSSSLSLAIFHSAAEIFEVLVTDSTAWSLHSWIGIAVDLHKALHMSSPGSNRKDAPTRLLEWIDAGVVYHRNGAIGLLRYAAVLASGGDAHLSSGSVLVSDSIDAEMVVSDPTIDSDGHIIDNLLGKLVPDKFFDGSDLGSTSITQLTTAFRILAFISEDSAIAATLFEEGAITLIYVVLVHCKYMLERLSNNYDYLVDEGAELSSTADLLFDRSHEQELIDLMIPSLLLLIHVLGKLQETKEVYRNKKLLKALLQLHREISPKLAACAADLSFTSSALGLGAVCHLITSAVAFWPVFGWAPNLFHHLLENVAAKLPVGPKDASSMLSLLGDLLPDEGIWQWKSEVPPLSALRNLSIGSILGPRGEKKVNWYMQPSYLEQLLAQLTPQLESISLVVLNFSTSGLMVMQDMLRVFIVHLSCQMMEGATILLDPIFSWLNDIANRTTLSDMEVFKVHQLLHFLAGLLEHPKAKEMFCKMGAVRTLLNILGICKLHSTNSTPFSWRIPLMKAMALIFSSQPSNDLMHSDGDALSMDNFSLLISHLFNLFQELPVDREMLACALAFKEVILSDQGRSALALILSRIQSSGQQVQEGKDWQQSPPFLRCFEKLLRCLDLNETRSDIVVEIIYALSLGTISILSSNESLEGISILRLLFGVPSDLDPDSDSYKEKLSQIMKLLKTLESKIAEDSTNAIAASGKSILHQAKTALRSISNILETSDPLVNQAVIDLKDELEPQSDIVRSVVMTAQLMPSTANSVQSITNELFLFSNAWRSILNSVKEDEESLYLGFMEKFVWELPQTAQSARRRLALGGEPPVKRLREGPEPPSSFSRGTSLPNAPTPTGPTRRDTFRQRKPNTSRPPSMHVDDYVARERNIDGASIGSNAVISTQRGRPPSIHVDEFIARQKQNSAVIPVATSTLADAPQVKGSSPVVSKNNNSEGDADKAEKPRQAKADLFDEQEINIDIDEESGSDDKGLFPQPDDNLQPPPVVTGENSPDSIETEAIQSPLTRPKKESISAQNPFERHERQVVASPVTRNSLGPQPPPGSLPGRSGPPASNQPPLPPMPPPGRAISTSGQSLDQVNNNSMPFGNPLRGLTPPIPGGFPLQPSDVNIPNALMGIQFQQENILQANAMLNSEANKFPWNFNSGGLPMRPMPPLPTQPYSLAHLQQALGNDPSLTNISASHPFAPLMLNRPMQAGPSSAMNQQRAPPPPPPSVPHPSQTMQQQSLGFPQVPLGFPQQLQFPQIQQMYYQNQQMGARPPTPPVGHVDPVQIQLPTGQTSQAGQTSNSSQQQQDPAAALQQYFSSPEAIQSLLSDRDKLCQLLETHPKLMQMLQEKLGQL